MDEGDEVAMLKRLLFQIQNAAIEMEKQVREKEKQLREYEDMDKRSDDFGPRTPLERIKMAHSIKKAEILANDYDEIEWSEDISPQQVGLRQVWGDENGSLWVIIKDGDKLMLKRLSQ